MTNIYYLSLTLFILVLAHSAISAPANPIGTIGARSGLGWNSGILPVGRVAGRDSYQKELHTTEGAAGRGRLNDIEHVYSWWDNNGGLQVLDWVEAPPAVTLIGYPPFPKGSSWGSVVAGTWDQAHINAGKKVASSRPNVITVFRIAYEFNGSWMDWPADSNFIAGYKRIVDKIKQGAGSKAGNIKFAWCMAGLDDSAGYTYQQLYPGDDYVDIVSIDIYDWPANFNQAQFNSQYHAGSALNTLLGFAKNRNKPFAIDEWGVHHTKKDNLVDDKYSDDGDDNPAFIHLMFDWVRANRDWIAYEVYFQDDEPTNVDSSLFSSYRNPNQNPLSKAAYLQEMQKPVTPAPTTKPVTPAPTTKPVTPAPTTKPATSAPVALTATVDEKVTTGTNRFTFTGSSWTYCGGCNPTTSYQNGFKYAYATNDYVVITFVGRQAKVYGIKGNAGIAAYSVDGGASVDVDHYSSATQFPSLVFTSPVLSSGTHTIKITVSGRKNSASTDQTITVDKLEVYA